MHKVLYDHWFVFLHFYSIIEIRHADPIEMCTRMPTKMSIIYPNVVTTNLLWNNHYNLVKFVTCRVHYFSKLNSKDWMQDFPRHVCSWKNRKALRALEYFDYRACAKGAEEGSNWDSNTELRNNFYCGNPNLVNALFFSFTCLPWENGQINLQNWLVSSSRGKRWRKS